MEKGIKKQTNGPDGVPEGFPYQEMLVRGRPCHGETDDFRRKHPQMDVGKRAKIFAPFAALRGFGEEITGAAENHVRMENLRG